MNNYINPANAVTASRFLTIPPYLYCIHHGLEQWATVLLIVCGLLDLVDGAVAKLFSCQSGFGELFDAVADAVCYGSFLLILVLYHWVPWPPVAILLGLGAVNTLMRGVYVRRAGRATNYRSFAMERIVGYLAFLVGVGVNHYQVNFYYYSGAALIIVVMLHDTKRMLLDPVPS